MLSRLQFSVGYTRFQSVDVNHQMILPPLGVLNVVGGIRQLLHNVIGTVMSGAAYETALWDNRGVQPNQSILLIVLSVDLAVIEIPSAQPKFKVLPHLCSKAEPSDFCRVAAYSLGDWV